MKSFQKFREHQFSRISSSEKIREHLFSRKVAKFAKFAKINDREN